MLYNRRKEMCSCKNSQNWLGYWLVCIISCNTGTCHCFATYTLYRNIPLIVVYNPRRVWRPHLYCGERLKSHNITSVIKILSTVSGNRFEAWGMWWLMRCMFISPLFIQRSMIHIFTSLIYLHLLQCQHFWL